MTHSDFCKKFEGCECCMLEGIPWGCDVFYDTLTEKDKKELIKMKDMIDKHLKDLEKFENIWFYSFEDYDDGADGIIIADTENDARDKLKSINNKSAYIWNFVCDGRYDSKNPDVISFKRDNVAID